jgi:cell division protein FtsN
MRNERGGILSKLFVIPIGVALMVGFFFLGYYVGKYQSKSGTQAEYLPPLPDVVSQNLPKKEEFTFFKTLTDKSEKTVSIDLKPKRASEESKPEKDQAAAEALKSLPGNKTILVETPKNKTAPPPVRKEKTLDIKIEKNTAAPKQPALKQPQIQAKKEPLPQTTNAKAPRYALQLSSYPDKATAEHDVKMMKQRGYAAFFVSAELGDKGTWYRVRLGSFTNKASAEKLRKELQTKEGMSPIVVTE